MGLGIINQSIILTPKFILSRMKEISAVMHHFSLGFTTFRVSHTHAIRSWLSSLRAERFRVLWSESRFNLHCICVSDYGFVTSVPAIVRFLSLPFRWNYCQPNRNEIVSRLSILQCNFRHHERYLNFRCSLDRKNYSNALIRITNFLALRLKLKMVRILIWRWREIGFSDN